MSDLAAHLQHFHFLRPQWLLALFVIPLVALLWRRLQSARDPWRNVVDGHLLAALREAGPVRRSRSPLVLILMTLALSVLALAGPAWQQLQQPLLRAESALIIALDLSDRMRAADVPPSRLARARFKIADLLKQRRDGQVALIAFAGDAFTVAPLTDDNNTLLSLVTSLDHDTLPDGGQRADRAISEASELLANAGFAQGDLLLITDRADARDLAAAKAASEAGLRISVLGVGTPAGAPIALPGGGFVRDAGGQMLLPRREDDSLQGLASAGDGRYQPMSVDASDLTGLDLLGPSSASVVLQKDDATSQQFRDEGAWLLLVLLPLAALLFRRGWLACAPLLLPVLMLTAPAPAAAFDFASLWQRDDQRAWQALQDEDPSKARELAADPALRGSAAYRAEDFAAAAEDFAQGDSADAHYNRGNALARAGQLKEAIAAYDDALTREPEMQDALANREVVQKALEQQQKQESEQQKGDEQQQSDKSEPSDQPGDNGEQSDSDQDGEQASDSEGDAQDSSDDAGEKNGKPPTNGEESEGDASDQAPSPTDAEQSEQQAQQFADEMAKALEEQKDEQRPAEREAQQALQQAEEQETPVAGLTPEELQAKEQQQAMEQLLRRVPDDPGGLLRRKFAIEARRRQLEGRDND